MRPAEHPRAGEAFPSVNSAVTIVDCCRPLEAEPSAVWRVRRALRCQHHCKRPILGSAATAAVRLNSDAEKARLLVVGQQRPPSTPAHGSEFVTWAWIRTRWLTPRWAE